MARTIKSLLISANIPGPEFPVIEARVLVSSQGSLPVYLGWFTSGRSSNPEPSVPVISDRLPMFSLVGALPSVP